MKTKKSLADYYLNNEFNLRQLIFDFEPYIRTIINNIVGDNLSFEDKEEIISDVFFIMWKNRESNVIALDSYLAEITRILIKEKLRKSKITYNLEDFREIAENSNIDIYLEHRQVVERLEKKFKNLREIDFKIITLFYYSDMSIKDISKKLHLSTVNVKTRLHRIRKKIKNELYKEEK